MGEFSGQRADDLTAVSNELLNRVNFCRKVDGYFQSRCGGDGEREREGGGCEFAEPELLEPVAARPMTSDTSLARR